VSALGNDLAIAHPPERAAWHTVAVLIGGPALYVLGSAINKQAIYGRLPLSHLAGLAGLMVLIPLALLTDLLMIAGLVATILLVVAGWESVARRNGLTVARPHPGN